MLKQADWTKPFTMRIDARNYALIVVLQGTDKTSEHTTEYASHLLTIPERNYSATEREALAINWTFVAMRKDKN